MNGFVLECLSHSFLWFLFRDLPSVTQVGLIPSPFLSYFPSAAVGRMNMSLCSEFSF